MNSSEASHAYFFDHLTSPSWILPLLKVGRFKQPPPILREENAVAFPSWPESRYLVRMAKVGAAPDDVLVAALSIPVTANVRVHEDLAEIATALPVDMAAKFVPEALNWINSGY